MDHYEISESGRPDRLSRQPWARSCGVSFSVEAPLPGCSWLAVLRVHALGNGLQRWGMRGIFKTHEKVGFKQVLERSDGVLGFAKTNIRFEEREFDRKLANRHAELVFWKKCLIIQNNTSDGGFIRGTNYN
jgi:hypothetical protein